MIEMALIVSETGFLEEREMKDEGELAKQKRYGVVLEKRKSWAKMDLELYRQVRPSSF